MLSAVTSVAFLWVLQYFQGNDQAGTNSAIVLPLKITVPVSIGLAGVITPSVAKAMKEFGARAATPVARQILLMGGLILLPYYLFVMAFPVLTLHLFLGHRYLDYLDAAPLVRLYVLNFAVSFLQVSLGSWLGGLGQSRLLFVTQIIKTIVGLCFSLPITAKWGLHGLIIGNLVVLSVESACYVYFIRATNRVPRTIAPLSEAQT